MEEIRAFPLKVFIQTSGIATFILQQIVLYVNTIKNYKFYEFQKHFRIIQLYNFSQVPAKLFTILDHKIFWYYFLQFVMDEISKEL